MLTRTRNRFDIPFEIIDAGSGVFMGALEDINLSEGSTIDWVAPRRILKVDVNLPLSPGIVIRSPLGMLYMVAAYSPSETSEGAPFRAFKLYEASRISEWRTTTTVIEPRTGLQRAGALSAPVSIYTSYEPLQEAFDRQLRIPNEKGRMITNARVKEGDVVDGETVIEVHEFQGLMGTVLA